MFPGVTRLAMRCGAGSGKPVGHRKLRKQQKRLSFAARAGDAQNFAIFEWSCAH